jgi:hypothetical protein
VGGGGGDAWVTVTARLRGSDVLRVDRARGDLSRSEWLRLAVLAFLGRGAGAVAVAGAAGAGEAVGRLQRAMAARQAGSPVRCVHSARGGPLRSRYCAGCRSLVDGEGWPVRLPVLPDRPA